MRMSPPTPSRWQRLLLAWLAAVLMLGHAPLSVADVAYKICPDPGVCFADKAAKDQWAKKNSCRFLEDVCSKEGALDNKGAPAEDQGFWGDLWSGIKGGLQYGYQFVKGIVAGLKDQVMGIVDLLRNFDEVIGGLVQLGKSFYNDPKGTAAKLAEVLGQEVVDTITRASQCGPYDLGKVIGQNVSPVLVAKLAIKITKFSGDIRRAARATKLELGCASFVAGTLVLTPAGPMPIEQVAAGQSVLSRNERGFADASQSVAKTFNRNVDHFYRLVTEFDALSVTDEHPLWLQGQGWTPVMDLKRGDIVATASGDVTVLDNERVERATRVFNFSVNETPSYFVGQGVWAHNAKCNLPDKVYRAPKSKFELGQSDGGPGVWSNVDAKGNKFDRGTGLNNLFEKEISGAPNNIEYLVNGKLFDGVDVGRKVLLDAKRYEPGNIITKPGLPPAVTNGFIANVLEDAVGSLKAAEKSRFTVEWHISGRLEAEAIRALLNKNDLAIIVVWSPRIGG